MKFIQLITRFIFILCLPVFIFTASVGLAFNSLSLYKYGFKKYDISRVTGIAPGELTKAARGLISYWNTGKDLIDTKVLKDGQSLTLYNEREVVHLKDVKALVRIDYLVLGLAGLYCIMYLAYVLRGKTPRQLREAALAGLGGSLATLGVLAALGIAVSLDFNSFWWQFHLLSFANDFWLLDPRTDYLVMMFPEGFWFDSVMVIAAVSGVMAIFSGGLSWATLNRNPSSNSQ
jgi:integral membrane protein (TIGR01906 family)